LRTTHMITHNKIPTNNPRRMEKVTPDTRLNDKSSLAEKILKDTRLNDKLGPGEIERIIAAYEKSIETYKWALVTIVVVVLGIFGFISFKDTQTYDKAVERAENAADQAKKAMVNINERVDEELSELVQGYLKENKQVIKDAINDCNEKFIKLKTQFDQEKEVIVAQAQVDISNAIEESKDLVQKNELWQRAWKLFNDGQYEDAIPKWAQLADKQPGSGGVWHNWGEALFGYAKVCPLTDRDTYFQEALKKYEKAFELYQDDSDKAHLMLRWGNVIASYASYKDGDTAQKLLDKAYEKYKSSANMDRTKSDALIDWAIALTKQGELAGQG